MERLDLLFWLFLLIALILIIWRLFGSPGYETVLAALVGAIGLLWREFSKFKQQFWKEFSDFKSEMREFTGQVKGKFEIK